MIKIKGIWHQEILLYSSYTRYYDANSNTLKYDLIYAFRSNDD